MPHASRIIANFEVTPLCDAVGPMGPALRLPLGELFPGSGLVDEPWVLHFHCYLLRGPDGGVTLVDTGIGTNPALADSWPLPGRLREELAAVGLAPGDVGTVIVTHMHSDHVGGSLLFPDAWHVIQQAELDWISPGMRKRVAEPLRDRIRVVDGDAEVVPGVRVRLTPGHTPGCYAGSGRRARCSAPGTCPIRSSPSRRIKPSTIYHRTKQRDAFGAGRAEGGGWIGPSSDASSVEAPGFSPGEETRHRDVNAAKNILAAGLADR